MSNDLFKLLPVYDSQNVKVFGNEIKPNVNMINAPAMWERSFMGQDVVIAVIDTGVDYNHPYLKENIINGRNFTPDYNGNTREYMDNHFHGTHVSGIIKDVAPKVKILALKALDKDGYGHWQDIINAINYAAIWRGPNGEKVQIVNMSLGGIEVYEMHNAIKKAINDHNILFSIAAGNAGDGKADTIEKAYPGYFNEVVSVGAVDNQMNLAWFSNTNDEVDIVAPGVDILSTMPGGKYAAKSGTSMSTPHVTATASLLINEFRAEYGRNPLESELYAQLCKRTKDIGLNRRAQGNGLIDLTSIKRVPTKRKISFVIGEKTYISDGVKKQMDTEPIIHRGRSLLPVRYIGNELNADIEWNAKTGTVTLEWEE